MQRDDSLLLDMLQAAEQIREYTVGLQEADFLESRRDQDAVLLQFMVLGETAKRVSSGFQDAHPEVLGEKSWGYGMLWSMSIFTSTSAGYGKLQAAISLH
ncbi:MAG: hypothetical protein OJF51_000243 [Nitrospira sp.]|jgi:uncharacterized protein with HEPN domain|nr:MAG: hypothetical protein OJF51_000243 [Nitrospira sp.]